jgi:hypothetical protein
MGLKGYGLWVNLIQPAEPHREPLLELTHSNLEPRVIHHITLFLTKVGLVVS